MQEADTGVLTPAEETRNLLGSQPPKRRPRNNTAWPDWSPEQKAILMEAGRRYRSVNNKTIEWKRALHENPAWKDILLAGGRPFYHLWHTSAEIMAGREPTRPGAGKKEGLSKRQPRTPRTPAPSRQAGGNKAWETRRKRYGDKGNKVVDTTPSLRPYPPAPEKERATPTMARVNHCPECGADLMPYHRAKELTR